MMSTMRQRVFGGIAFVAGTAFVVWQWREFAVAGTYHRKAAFVMPALAVLGATLLLFPVSRDDLMRRYGVERPSSLNHYSLAQKAMFVLVFVAGGLNWALISGTLSLR